MCDLKTKELFRRLMNGLDTQIVNGNRTPVVSIDLSPNEWDFEKDVKKYLINLGFKVHSNFPTFTVWRSDESHIEQPVGKSKFYGEVLSTSEIEARDYEYLERLGFDQSLTEIQAQMAILRLRLAFPQAWISYNDHLLYLYNKKEVYRISVLQSKPIANFDSKISGVIEAIASLSGADALDSYIAVPIENHNLLDIELNL